MLIKISDPKGEKSFFVRKMFAFSAVKKLNEAGMIKLSFPDDLAGLEEFEIKKGFLIQAFLPDEKKKVHCIFSGYIEERSIVGNVVNLVGYDFIGYAKHRMIREDLKFQNTAIKSIIETIFWKLNAVSVLPFSLGKNNGEELISIEFKAFTSLYTILKELSKKVSDLQIRHRSEIVGNGSKEYLDISKNCGVQHSWIWSDNANIQQRNSKVVSREWKDSLWNTCNYWRDNNGNIRENQSSISQWLLFEKFEQNPEKTPDELVESAGLVTIVPEVSREEMTQLTVGDQKAIRLIARLEWARFEYLGIIQEVSFGSNSAGGLDFSIKIWEKLIEQKNILDKTLANLASAVKKSWPSNAPAPSVDLSWYATSSAVNQAIQSQNTKIEKKADSSFVQWVAQTAQTALNTANQAKQTAESKAPIQHTHNKSEVWLDNVDNTSDEDKPLSKATKKALELKCSFADIVDNLNTEEIKPLSAKQGKVLKGLIDNINRILISDDTDLDQLQEIVNYIKQNKKILSQLGISNISGLVEALEGKANKVHTHTKSQISDFPTSMPASDVHKRAKQANKPTYTISEIQGLQEALDNKSSSVASLDRIDFNYTTNLTQKKFRIGSRYQLSNVPHDQGGHQLQVLWWDLQPQGTGDDGGWGLIFWPDQNPYLQMQWVHTYLGRTDWWIKPKNWINPPNHMGMHREANSDRAQIVFNSNNNDDTTLDFKLGDDGSEWFRFMYIDTWRAAFNYELATFKQKFFAHAQFGEFPTISLAIWDSDTGFNWNGDGNFTMKANGADLNHFYNGRAPIVRQGMNNGEIKNLTKDAYANENKRSEVIYMVDKEWVFIGDKQIASCWGGGLDLIAVDKTIVWDASGTRTAPSDWLLFFQWEWGETRYWSAKAYINEVDVINILLFSHENLIARNLHYGLGIIKVRKWDITLRTTSWNYGQYKGKIILKYFIPS